MSAEVPSGDVYAACDVYAAGDVYAACDVYAAGDVYAACDVYAAGGVYAACDVCMYIYYVTITKKRNKRKA